jgi:hypothetical protein
MLMNPHDSFNFSSQNFLGAEKPLGTEYARHQTDPAYGPQLANRQGGNLFDHVVPQVGRNTGWNLADVRRPLPPYLEKRPNCMLNTDFQDLIGPPVITESGPYGNQVWMTQRVRDYARENAKVNSGRGALDYYNLFPNAIATGGGGGAPGENVYGFTFKGVGNAGRVRAMPTAPNYRKEVIDNRTRLGDKAYAKPGSMAAQERSQLGLLQAPKNADLYEIPWRTMMPTSSGSASFPAGPENILIKEMRRGDDTSYGGVYMPPGGSTVGGQQFLRNQQHNRLDTKQSVHTGYNMHMGGKPWGDWSQNEALDTRLAKAEFTQFASRPPNPGFIGGMDFVADVNQPVRNLPATPKHTLREENIDYEYNRFKVPTVTYALQYNQQFPYYGDRRKTPEVRMDTDSAILAPFHKNPFTQPLNPYMKKDRRPLAGH